MMRYRVEVGSQYFEVELRQSDNGSEIVVDGQSFLLTEASPLPIVRWQGETEGTYVLEWEGQDLQVTLHPIRSEEQSSGGTKPSNLDQAQKFHEGGKLLAPMPGKVLTVICKEGQPVQEGELLLVLEAMKMENEIVAPAAGMVKKVLVEEGQSVAYNDILVELGE